MNYFFEIRKTENRTFPNMQERPTCSVPGCGRPAVNTVAKSHPRYPTYRRSNWIKETYPDADDIWCCDKCHRDNTARVHGVESSVHLTAKRKGKTITEYRNDSALATAKKNGFDNITDYRNSIHPYLWARKDYCENIDGRLGFKCNTVLPTQEMLNNSGLKNWKPKYFLEVDHIDGNSSNNAPDGSNFQTLCKHCHMIKSFQSGDHLTPGRKTIKKGKLNVLKY
jgi:hypothetical protein